jgi:hypothetical protein
VRTITMPDMLRHTTSSTIAAAPSSVLPSASASVRRRAPMLKYGSIDADFSALVAG